MLFNSFCAQVDTGFDGKPSEMSSMKTKVLLRAEMLGNIVPSWIHGPVTQRGTDVETSP